MATGQISEVMQHLRQAALRRDGAGLTDGQLLECFLSRREEAAVAALVKRHGPMVWGVCRRMLSNYHDAEDAFQATFLVLLRKASSIVSREKVANWLYGVAHQTAVKARAAAARRKGRERQVSEMPEPAVAEEDLWRDLQPLLDQELSRLPDKYRVVIVLCDLEGKTRKEAARQLGCPEGTIAGRLARGRTILAKRLARHGLAVVGGTLAAGLSESASACVPVTVESSTIKAGTLFAVGQTAVTGAVSVKVAALTEGVLKTMLIAKLRAAMVMLAMGLVLIAGVSAYNTVVSEPKQHDGEPPRANERKAALKNKAERAVGKNDPEDKTDETLKQPAAKAGDKAALQGTWQVVSIERGGNAVLAQRKEEWVVKGQWIRVHAKDTKILEPAVIVESAVFKADPTKTPKEIDINPYLVGPFNDSDIAKGIYTLDGDVLKVCLAHMPMLPGKEDRPKEMVTKKGSDSVLITLKRIKPGEQPVGKEQGKKAEGQIAKELKQLQGIWIAESAQPQSAQFTTHESAPYMILTIKGNALQFEIRAEGDAVPTPRDEKVAIRYDVSKYMFAIDPATNPKRLWTTKTEKEPAAFRWFSECGYEVTGDRLRIVANFIRGGFPDSFTATENRHIYTFRRVTSDPRTTSGEREK